MQPTNSTKMYQWGFVFVGLIALQRVLTIWLLGVLTKGQHFSDDWNGITAFIAHPWQILLGRDEGGWQFWPPLFPVLIAPLGQLWSYFFDNFHALRLLSVSFELLAAPFLWAAICRNFATTKQRLLSGALYILLPVAIGSTAGMAQDESVSMLWLGILMLLTWAERSWLAAFLAGFGATCCKIYFLIPLAGISLTTAGRETLRKGTLCLLLGFVPIALIYGFSMHNQIENLGEAALTKFASAGTQGVSLWALVQKGMTVNFDVLRRMSSGLSLFFAVAPIGFFYWKGIRFLPDQVVALLGSMLLAVLLWFSHTDPEYYLMTLPFLFASLGLGSLYLLAGVGLSFTFLANLGYGIMTHLATGSKQGGKQVFVDLYQRFIPVDVSTFHSFALLMVILTNLALTAMLYRRVWTLHLQSQATANELGHPTLQGNPRDE